MGISLFLIKASSIFSQLQVPCLQGEQQRLSGAGGLSAEQFIRADLARYLQSSSDPAVSALLEANRGSQGHAAEDLHREVGDFPETV